jgi:hypothetical protein
VGLRTYLSFAISNFSFAIAKTRAFKTKTDLFVLLRVFSLVQFSWIKLLFEKPSAKLHEPKTHEIARSFEMQMINFK